jgi:flagellar hook-associated protein FlgK
MGASFSGIELMKRAIFSHRSAIQTTGHNISNVETEGYSRQRVNYVETKPINGMSRNRLQLPGQIGSGVELNVVERIRVQYIDFQYRNETSRYGYYQTKSDELSRMEAIFNEPSDHGLAHTMDSFWKALQDLSVDPTSNAARSIVRQRGVEVAENFNYLYRSLKVQKQQVRDQLDTKISEINTLAVQINELNSKIRKLESTGFLPNDLYDQRDSYVDQLSELVTIKVTALKSGNSSMPIADGVYTIEIVGEDGSSTFGNTKLVDGDLEQVNSLSIQEGINGSVASIRLGDTAVKGYEFNSIGEIKALIDLQGFENANGEVEGTFPWMLAELDNMAFTFAGEFNKIHEQGNSLYEHVNGPMDIPFFADAVSDRIAEYPTDTVDIVFVVDNSGSMQNKLDTVATKLADFVQELKSGSITTVNFGLVKYLDQPDSITFSNNNIWTDDINDLKAEINQLDMNGATENLMDALNSILPIYGGNETFKHIIFVTDESDDNVQLSSSDILDQFTERGVQIHGIYNPSFPYNIEDLTNIVNDTGGVTIDINSSDWATQLTTEMGKSIREYVESGGQGSAVEGYAGRIRVSDEIINDINKIAAAVGATNGEGENALKLADVYNMKLPFDSDLSDFKTYYSNIIGQLGVMSQESIRMNGNSQVLRNNINENRQSISSVSLDEEFTNLIQFQHAFNAASRQITTMDEVLDRIINKL